jgi:hypothetical protein
MPLPPPRLLSLSETVRFVAACCEVTADDARAALNRAVREHSLTVFRNGGSGDSISGSKHIQIDWTNSIVTHDIQGIRYLLRDVRVFRSHLIKWMGLKAQPSSPPDHEKVAVSTEIASQMGGEKSPLLDPDQTPTQQRSAAVSDKAWSRYLEATRDDGFPDKRGSIRRAARKIARSSADSVESVRRDLTRVIKVVREK